MELQNEMTLEQVYEWFKEQPVPNRVEDTYNALLADMGKGDHNQTLLFALYCYSCRYNIPIPVSIEEYEFLVELNEELDTPVIGRILNQIILVPDKQYSNPGLILVIQG